MGLQGRACGLLGGLVLANAAAIVAAFLIGRRYASLASPVFLAYTFGLRHAVDADHIAAIDNVTRKLLSAGLKPLTVGFWFSIGHSTVVSLMCFVIATWGDVAKSKMQSDVGAVIGTMASAGILFFIGSLNLYMGYTMCIAMRRLRRQPLEKPDWPAAKPLDMPKTNGCAHPHRHFVTVPKWVPRPPKTVRRAASKFAHFVRCGHGHSHHHNGDEPFLSDAERHDHGHNHDHQDHGHSISAEVENGCDAHEHDFTADHGNGIGHTHIVAVSADAEISGPGCLSKLCPRIFRVVDRPWKMYPIGFLFGLGFDTASEVALLAMAALATQDNVPRIYIMVLPLLFASGMALLDTLDGVLMLWAYSLADIDPVKRLFFNFYLTVSSALIAILVGFIEFAGCLKDELHFKGVFWDTVGVINDNFQDVGVGIITFFAVSTALAVFYMQCCMPVGVR